MYDVMNPDGVRDYKYSEYFRVRIPISAGYYWGEGWRNRSDKYSFDNEIPQLLKEEGFIVKESDMDAGCPIVDNPRGAYLYLHPSEFTGYLTEKELEKVLNILDRAKSVKNVGNVTKEPVYLMSDFEYRKILEENLVSINDWIDQNPKLDGFDWAQKYRIERFRDSCIYSSSDVDVQFVNLLIDIKKVYNMKLRKNSQVL